MSEPDPLDRRSLLISTLMAAVGSGVWSTAGATPLDPDQTKITPVQDLVFTAPKGAPPDSVESVMLSGGLNDPGLYFTLVRWRPGYMSAPHTYLTDRLCVVVSGVWWVNSGADFDPARCRPVAAGGFVRRVAGTPHYDGVVRQAPEPATIAICGLGPVGARFLDPALPNIRRV